MIIIRIIIIIIIIIIMIIIIIIIIIIITRNEAWGERCKQNVADRAMQAASQGYSLGCVDDSHGYYGQRVAAKATRPKQCCQGDAARAMRPGRCGQGDAARAMRPGRCGQGDMRPGQCGQGDEARAMGGWQRCCRNGPANLSEPSELGLPGPCGQGDVAREMLAGRSEAIAKRRRGQSYGNGDAARAMRPG